MATTITQDTATRMMRGAGNTIPGLKSQQVEASKLLEALEQGQRDLAELASTTLNETERLASIVNKRQAIQSKIMRSANKEVNEHYKSVLASVKKQEDFVRETVRMEEERNKLAAEHDRLLDTRNKKLAKLEVVDKEHLERMEVVGALLQKQSAVINARIHAEREGLKTGKEIAGVHKQITESMEKQEEITKGSAFAEKYNEQMKSMRDNAGKFGFEIDGLTKKQSLFIHGLSSVAGFFTLRKALDLGKQGLMGFAEAADAATEARYRYGTSLSRHDKGVGTYLSDAGKMVSMNTDVGLSFARMGLDADDAKDIIPKLLAKNGTAMRYYADGNNAALTDMAKSAGAFSRQTGVSVDEAMELQSEMMEAKQMTSKQAEAAMNSVAGSVRGMNDALSDAGFKGALLNVGQMTELVTEAAKSAETASFSVDAYAKTLAKAAGAARAFGMSEKSAAQYAKTRADAANSEDGYAELQRGKRLSSFLGNKYGADAKTGDAKAMVAKLMAEENLAQEDAENIASMLIANAQGKGGPMFENRLAKALAGTAMNDKAFADNIKSYLDKQGFDPKDPTILNRLQTDPVFLQMYGKNVMDREAMHVAQGAIAEWKADKGIVGSAVKTAPTKEKVDEAQKKATEEASAAKTAENSSASLSKLKNHAQALWNNPALMLGNGVGLTGAVLAGNAGIKAATGGTSMFGKIMGMLGRGGAEAAEGAAGAASRGAAASTIPGLVDNAGRSIGGDVAESASRGKFLKNFVSGIARSKLGKVGLAVAGANALGSGLYAWRANSSSTDKTENNGDIDSTSPEASKERNAVSAWFQQQGMSPEQMVTVNALLAKGVDPGTIADLMKIPSDAVLSAFDVKTGKLKAGAVQSSPTSPNTVTWKPPALATDIGLAAAAGATDLGMHYGMKGAGKLATAMAPNMMANVTGKLAGATAAKAAGGLAAKSAARAIPVLGALLSPLMTAYTTEGPAGRKALAALGDLGGTALGQFVTGGFGGGIVGGAAGSLGGAKLYDTMFGGNSSGAVDNMSQAQKQIAAQNAPAGLPNTGSNAPLLSAGGIGSFGTMNPNGNTKVTLPITFDIAGLPQVVQQANSFNLARQTQYSGAKT